MSKQGPLGYAHRMETPLYHVDAFTDQPFAGNPAAVCWTEAGRDDAWKQAVAAEMNLSETAFVSPRAAGDGFDLQWFTPAAEVELCGHATLASAHVLWETGRAPTDEPIRFHTRHRGVLTCARPETGWIAMDFPADTVAEQAPPVGLAATLGVEPVRIVRAPYDWVVELTDEAAVRAAEPDFASLARFDMRGVALTAPGKLPGVDYVCRFFAPRLRINEDPVTGSLQCVLGPYWAARLGKDTLAAEQVSSRGGRLRVTVRGDRVDLAGQAVTVARGHWVG